MKRTNHESGMALMSTLLIMMLMSALLVGFFAMIAADQQATGVNRDQTQAYAAAHAGLEKLTADLGSLFTGGNYSPTPAQLSDLEVPPVLPGFGFPTSSDHTLYKITCPPSLTECPAAPIAVNALISKGAFDGLQGQITSYVINVTARASGNTVGGAAEVKMRREVQTVAVPVFQFGIYSENDLSFFAGPNFDFGGRVHTNQNAYLAQDGTATLTVRDIFTAVGEVVRTHLANGVALSSITHKGYVSLALSGGTAPTFRALSCGPIGGACNSSVQEGSVVVTSVPPSTLQDVGTPPRKTMVLVAGNTANEPTWTNVAHGIYADRIKNGRTGAKRLDLPLVSDGALPVDLIRRPSIAAPDTAAVLDQRFFKMASVRILLSDRAADITDLQPQSVTATPPIDLARLTRDTTYRTVNNGLGTAITFSNSIPLALAGTYNAANGYGYRVPAGTPLTDGFLKIERQNRDGVWSDVTVEILNRGFTGRNLGATCTTNATTHVTTCTWGARGSACLAYAPDDPSPNAVIRLQRVRDNPSIVTTDNSGVCGHVGAPNTLGTWSTAPTDYLPNTLYDAREGARRDDPTGTGTVPLIGGVMHYVELDVNNLRLWLATHPDTMDLTGYVVYFSDRRGNKDRGADGVATAREGVDGILYTADDFGTDDQETGELGFEDIINPASAQSVSNGALDTGEDVNGNGVVDVYGGVPRLYPTAVAAYSLPNPAGLPAAMVWPPALGYQPNSVGRPSTDSLWAAGTTVTLTTPVPANEARVNPPVFFRRALKVVNGGYYSTTLKLPHNGAQGLSVVAENPLYVQGDYNVVNTTDGTTNTWGTVPGTDHVSAALIADAVTLLSNNFNDIGTFQNPHAATGGNRTATTTGYRMAVISGKGLNFPRPTSNTANDHTDFGTDGGAHNFLRYIENWGGAALNYRGSIVSFYLNRQAVGIYKCCDVVYSPPSRGYKFDSDFLSPGLLPPRTPMFRDINTLTFRQLLRPNQ